MNYTELTKLFPEVRIPFFNEAEYYLDLLKQGGIITDEFLAEFTTFEKEIGDVKKYKLEKMDEIVAHLKTYSLEKDYNNTFIYPSKDSNDVKPDKLYISLDMKQANWTAFKSLINQQDLPDWETWVKEKFSLHPLLAKSKSFRQFIFGNVNPKKLNAEQKSLMAQFIKESEASFVSLLSSQYYHAIIAFRPDELLFEFPIDDRRQLIKKFNEIIINYPGFRATFFMITEHTNHNEFVRIRNIINDSNILKRELMHVPGNRFFLHYKNLILHQPHLNDKDLLFRNDKHLARWVI